MRSIFQKVMLRYVLFSIEIPSIAKKILITINMFMLENSHQDWLTR